MSESVKYIVVGACVITPMFIMASELDEDEFAKSGVGIAMAAVVLGAMKLVESWVAKTKRE
jgi:hypothetical protein